MIKLIFWKTNYEIFLGNSDLIKNTQGSDTLSKENINLIIFNSKNEETKDKFMEELEKKSINSFNSFISYSENSQHQIIKMEKEIKILKSKIKNSKIVLEDKKNIKIIFFDKEKNIEFPLEISYSDGETFSIIINYLFEKFPELEEKGIKKFIYNGKQVLRNKKIKEIGLINNSKIIIQF